MSAHILIVDDEDGIRSFMAESLASEDYEISTAADGEEALGKIRSFAFDLVITDWKMPKLDGMELLKAAKKIQPDLQVVMLTAHGSIDGAVEAMREGAFDYLAKPISGPEALRRMVSRGLALRSLGAAKHRAEVENSDIPPLSWGAPVMDAVSHLVSKVAPTPATVLLQGESGTGKTVVARHIHQQSPRRDQPFIAINCAALTDSLIESELFGHEKGAFTGADARRVGRIELARGGTLFLDEVGELKPELQAKLLRVLQERRYERVGGSQTLEAQVRWISATNRDLQEMIEAGTFREDLFHRLAVFPIDLPPLRERREDIAPLANAILKELANEAGRSPLKLTSDAVEALTSAPWRGNVRELRNALERATILAESDTIDGSQFMLQHRGSGAAPASAPGQTLAELEAQALQRALDAAQGNRKQAAQALDIGVRTLYEKIKRYGLS